MREVSSVRAVAPVSSQSIKVVFGNQNWSIQVIASDAQYLQVTNRSINSGRVFSDSEVRSGPAVCIIGDTVREKLFGGQEVIGERIRLNGSSTSSSSKSNKITGLNSSFSIGGGKISCEVIGVLESKEKMAGMRRPKGSPREVRFSIARSTYLLTAHRSLLTSGSQAPNYHG
jgi:putative ABC transport system permease protein